jgi:hypothetical protein
MRVRKHRRFYAPVLVRLGVPLAGILDTGVRVLSRLEWQERERELYQRLYGTRIDIDRGGALILPHLPGKTLATLLEESQDDGPARRRAIELAVVALTAFHRLGFTHGDAMAENVQVDVEGGVARWFDFETVHDPDRPLAWRRADDLRALLATCLLRTPPDELAGTVHLFLDRYPDAEVTGALAEGFSTVLRRPLAFHLGQAGLSYRCFGEVARVLGARIRPSGVGP